MVNLSYPEARNAGTGGPVPGSTFECNGKTITRDAVEGCIPDELVDKTSNEPGTLSMARLALV